MTDSDSCLGKTDVVILAGGLGTRIQDTLGDTPKILAPIGDRPFLDILLSRLAGFGVKRVVLGLGHLGKKVVAHLDHNKPKNLKIITAIEATPLGTAGALRFLAPRIESDPVMVMNGDSFTGADLCRFLNAHRKSGAEGSILTARVKDTARYGRLEISKKGRIEEFLEKSQGANGDNNGPGVINAGVYLFNASMLARIATMGGASLEKDVFQALPAGTLGAVTGRGPFIDIGTPADLARAPKVLKPYF